MNGDDTGESTVDTTAETGNDTVDSPTVTADELADAYGETPPSSELPAPQTVEAEKTEPVVCGGEVSKSEVPNTEHISCIREDLAGQTHPETGVLYESRTIEMDGKQYDVVVPRFDSFYECKLDESEYQLSDYRQFTSCTAQLRSAVENDPELASRFDDKQLEQIRNLDTPRGFTWHHDAEPGRMQLVETGIHTDTRHTGGRSIWGGGSANR